MTDNTAISKETSYLKALEQRYLAPRLVGYIGWAIMNNQRTFLGSDMPVGGRRWLANPAMGLCIVMVVIALGYTTLVKLSASV